MEFRRRDELLLEEDDDYGGVEDGGSQARVIRSDFWVRWNRVVRISEVFPRRTEVARAGSRWDTRVLLRMFITVCRCVLVWISSALRREAGVGCRPAAVRRPGWPWALPPSRPRPCCSHIPHKTCCKTRFADVSQWYSSTSLQSAVLDRLQC